MKTIRLLVGLTSLLAVLAIAASPAAAEFEANQAGTTQGPYQLKTGTSTTFEAGAAVKCTSVANGVWHIQTLTKQEATKRGAHQEITGQFTGCTGPLGVSASVNSSCALQVAQAGTSFTGSVSSTCTITVLNCVVTIAAGAPNTNLKTIKSVNITGGKEDISTVEGITSTVKEPECKNFGITAGKVGKFEGNGIAHSQKVI